MENGNNSSAGFWLIGAIIVIIYFWQQNSSLQTKITAYQEQSDAYEQCVSDYQSHEDDLTTTIQNTSDDLESGGTDGYESAQDELNSADTSSTSCDIPTVEQ